MIEGQGTRQDVHAAAGLPAEVDAATVLCRELRPVVGDQAWAAWFAAVRFEGFADGVARLSVPTRFLKTWLTTRYGVELLAAVQAWNPDVVHVDLHVRNAAASASASRARHAPSTVVPLPVSQRRIWSAGVEGSPLSPGTALSAFVLSPSNAAALDLVASVSQGEPGPAVIRGGKGTGKTHLAQGLARSEAQRGKRVLYLTVKGVEALVSRGHAATVGQAQVVVLDDVHMLGAKAGQAMAAVLDASRQAVVLTASESDGAGLASFGPVLVGAREAHLGPLDGDGIAELVVRLARGEPRPEDVLSRMSEFVDGAPMTAAAVLGQFHRMASGLKGEPPVAGEGHQVRVEDIQRACASHYGVSVQDLLSARRTANVVRPRQVAIYLAKALTAQSLPEIGRRFGGRDHTTVLHAVRKVTALRESDPWIEAAVATIERVLRS